MEITTKKGVSSNKMRSMQGMKCAGMLVEGWGDRGDGR